MDSATVKVQFLSLDSNRKSFSAAAGPGSDVETRQELLIENDFQFHFDSIQSNSNPVVNQNLKFFFLKKKAARRSDGKWRIVWSRLMSREVRRTFFKECGNAFLEIVGPAGFDLAFGFEVELLG